jgi:ankyrin repeat protein
MKHFKELNMKRALIAFIFLSALILLSACGAPAMPSPAATPLPLPTDTLSPEALKEVIFTAAREDDLASMKQYIAAGADINASDEFGGTALSIAAYRGNTELVRLLLDSGATFEIGVFHTAIAQSNDNTEIVQIFIDHGADLNQKADTGNGHTALMFAAEFGHMEVGKLLLANGADINAVDNYNDPALNVAAFHGQLEFAKMLVEMGAELNVPGYAGRTALGHAISRGHEDVATFLREVGATE